MSKLKAEYYQMNSLCKPSTLTCCQALH